MSRTAVIGLAMALAVAFPARAAKVGGVELTDALEVSGHRLELASCGVRDTMWIDHYAAGLYVPSGAGAKAAADAKQATAVRMKIINARYLPGDIPAKWRGALDRELGHEPMMRVRRAYDKLQDGDVVTFSYVPSQGVTMQLNDRKVIDVGGHAVIDSILAAWRGRDPIGEKLHRLALHHRCGDG